MLHHGFEAVCLGCKFFSSGLRAFDSEAELEVFLVAYQDIGDGGDFFEDGA
jgi:hypothetical protein